MSYFYISELAFLLPGHLEWLLLALLALVFFGKRLPEAARSLGQSWRQFKKGLDEDPPAQDSSEDSPEDETGDDSESSDEPGKGQ